MVLKALLIIATTLSVASCSNSSTPDEKNTAAGSEIETTLASLDETDNRSLTYLEQAIWVLDEVRSLDGIVSTAPEAGQYSLKFSLLGQTGITELIATAPCSRLTGMYIIESIDRIRLQETSYSNECEASSATELTTLFDSIIKPEVSISYSISDNRLELKTEGETILYFVSGADSRLDYEPLILDQTILDIRFQEHTRIESDLFWPTGKVVTVSIDNRSDAIDKFVNSMSSTSIYLNHECLAENQSIDLKPFYLIRVRTLDSNSYVHAAGISCGYDLRGGRRYSVTDVEVLNTILITGDQ